MKLHPFSVSIPEGQEGTGGYVGLNHGTHYSILLRNDSGERCDAEVCIDGQRVGIWRVKGRSAIRLERPVHDTGRFTFFQVGTPEAAKAGINEGQGTGLIRVIFKPERKVEWLGAACPGGTGLSGSSEQRFGTVAALDYDEGRFVTIHLRLVTDTDEPRPLFPRSTTVPPPVR